MKQHCSGWTRTILIAGVAIIGVALLTQAYAAPVDARLKRQLNVMEKVFDEILVDSPNLLVMSTNPTQGYYLDEFGALLVFEASLTGGMGRLAGLEFLNEMKVVTKDGKTIVTFTDDEDSSKSKEAIKEYVDQLEKKYDRDADEDDDEDADVDEEETLSEAQRYAAGKQELIEGLVDYGETMTSLRDDQWVAVMASLDNADIFEKSEISRLVLKVRMRDLRANADGQLGREALMQRVQVEEY